MSNFKFLLKNTRKGHPVTLIQVFNDGVRVQLKGLVSDVVMIDCSVKFLESEISKGRITRCL